MPGIYNWIVSGYGFEDRCRVDCSEATHDKCLYKDQYLVENFFLKLKNSRRIATRFEKNLANSASMIHLACILV
jgi:transposase